MQIEVARCNIQARAPTREFHGRDAATEVGG